MAATISRCSLYLLMLGMLLIGTVHTVFLKIQNLTYFTSRDGREMQFNHAFFQTFFMFFGELLFLIPYGVIHYMNSKKYGKFSHSLEVVEAKSRGLRADINVCLLAIPAFFDMLGSTLMFMSLTMLAASIYQMMGGLIVFASAILSIIFLKRRYYRHHWTALVFVIVGAVIVGASPLIYSVNDEEQGTTSGTIVGIILLVLAQFFAAGLFIAEEKLLNKYYIHPLKLVGWEGFWGTGIYLILLTIFQFIKCDSEDICPHGRLEDTPQALFEFGNNPLILLYGVIATFSLMVFNI